jgi:hypothetical protein
MLSDNPGLFPDPNPLNLPGLWACASFLSLATGAGFLFKFFIIIAFLFYKNIVFGENSKNI